VTAATSPHDIGMCPRWDADGTPLLRWIEVISGQCVYGTLGGVSWSFGRLIDDSANSRILVDLIMALCAAASNHHKLSKQFCRRTLTDIPDKLVYGNHHLGPLT
jgi:hypothetical protein